MKKILGIFSLCLLVSCGGGGGGDDFLLPSFQGVWDAQVTFVSECPDLIENGPSTDVLTINQEDSDVTVTYSDGTVETGNVDSENSFTVTGFEQVNDDCSVDSITRLTDFSDNRSNVTASAKINCEGRESCNIAITGTAVRR